MWPFTLFKKISQDPPVGETRGDYIGCYLLGTQTAGRDDDISYISLATTREQLERDAREFLEQFLHDNPQARAGDREAVQQLLDHLGARIDEHLARNDAWGFFAGLDDLLVTGPTHTNVNDFRVLLIS